MGGRSDRDQEPDVSETAQATQWRPAAKVSLEEQGQLVAIVALEQERTLVGRGAHCDVRLTDRAVSGDHLEVNRHGAAFVVTDLGSRNGTLLNGQRLVRPTRLADGDTLVIGQARLRFTMPSAIGVDSTEMVGQDPIALTDEEAAVAVALVRRFREPGAIAARPSSRSEIAEVTHLAERTVTRRLETLAAKLRLGPHEPRERAHLLAQRILELGLDRQRS